jgi:hypothetical protein
MEIYRSRLEADEAAKNTLRSAVHGGGASMGDLIKVF